MHRRMKSPIHGAGGFFPTFTLLSFAAVVTGSGIAALSGVAARSWGMPVWPLGADGGWLEVPNDRAWAPADAAEGAGPGLAL